MLFFIGVAIGTSGSTTKTTTTTVAAEPITETVVQTEPITETVTRPKPRPKPAADGGTNLSGDGSKDVRVSIPNNSTLYWTNDGDLFQVADEDYTIHVSSSAHRGSTDAPAGTYRLTINAIGSWTISIR